MHRYGAAGSTGNILKCSFNLIESILISRLAELGRRERFRVFAHLTRRRLDDAMGEVTIVLK